MKDWIVAFSLAVFSLLVLLGVVLISHRILMLHPALPLIALICFPLTALTVAIKDLRE